MLSSLSVPAAFAEDLVLQLDPAEVPQWSGVPVPSFDQVPDDFVSVLQANPILLLGGVAIIAIPVLLAQGLFPAAGPKAKITRAEKALEALSAEPRTLLVDIRSAADVKAEGSPVLGKVLGKSLAAPYTKVAKDGSVEEVEDWASRVAKSLKEDSIVILLDADGKLAPKAGAILLSEAEFESLYYVQEGAEGWKAKDLPWKVKAKGFSFSLPGSPNFDSLAADFKDAPSVGKAALAVGAIGAASVLLFNELGSVLELVGLFGAVNLVGRNFLFAKDRKRTNRELRSLVDDRIAVQDAGEDLKKLARTVLETPAPAVEKAAKKLEATASKIESAIAKTESKAESAVEAPKAASDASSGAESELKAKEWIDQWRAKA